MLRLTLVGATHSYIVLLSNSKHVLISYNWHRPITGTFILGQNSWLLQKQGYFWIYWYFWKYVLLLQTQWSL